MHTSDSSIHGKTKASVCVYDDETLERLLDREALWKPKSSSSDCVESELIFFRPNTAEAEEESDTVPLAKHGESVRLASILHYS